MKIGIILIALLLVAFPCYASDVGVEVKAGLYFPTDEEIQKGKNVQANLEWKNIYLFGQWISTERRIAGQRAGMLDIYGIGVGLKMPINKYLKVWSQIGYYIPNSEMSGTMKFEESQWLYWRDFGERFAYNGVTPLTVYSYEIKSDFGGAIGLEGKYPITKHIETGLDFGYNLLQFKEQFWARHPKVSESWIETRQTKNFSGFTLGLSATWRF